MKYTHNKRVKNFFPIHMWRFNTENHPIIKSEAQRRAKLVVPLSHNEKRILDGLANTLKCAKNEAVRIALYEFSKQRVVSDEVKAKASPLSNDPSHTSRRNKLTIKLPAAEKPGKFLGLTEKEVVRAALIWLRNGIRNDEITELTNSPLIHIEELAKEWSLSHKDNHETKSSIKRMKEVREENAETTRMSNEAVRNHRYAQTQAYIMENPYISNMLSEGLLEYHDVEMMALSEEDQTEKDFILDVLDDLSLSPEEEEEPLSEEELAAMIEGTFQAIQEGAKKPPIEVKFSDKFERHTSASRYDEEDWDRVTKEAIDRYDHK